MATPRSTRSSGAVAASKKPMPKALASRARTLHEARRQRLAAVGFDAIARVREHRADISASFYDIGEALVALQGDGVADALGCEDFDAICREHLDMSPTHAARLVDLVGRLTRELALSLGVDRASALMALVDATPDDDAPPDILHATLALPSGKRLAVEKASTEALYAAAKEFRQAAAAPAKRSRGLDHQRRGALPIRRGHEAGGGRRALRGRRAEARRARGEEGRGGAGGCSAGAVGGDGHRDGAAEEDPVVGRRKPGLVFGSGALEQRLRAWMVEVEG